MNRNVLEKSGIRRIINLALTGVIATATLTFAAKIEVPLFLFSGQSNMVCLGASGNDLNADQKKAVDNVNKSGNIKIDCVADNNTKKWSSLGMGFGADATHFGVELFFGITLSDSMSGKKFAFIKNAKSGTYLGQTGGWLPPSSNNGTGGTLYKGMMTQIDNALKTFKDAFDTTQYTPRWSGFIWLQGEFDGMDATLANKYEENMTNLIKDIRTKTGVADLPVIMPMIKPISTWQYAAKVRAANIAIKAKLTNCDTMDTKDLALSSDNVHYNGQSMAIIGTRCAQRWLAMKYIGTVPVIYQEKKDHTNFSDLRNASENAAIFNLSGRQIGSSIADVNNRSISSGSIIYHSKIISTAK
jgi:hypothetical protein